MWQGNVFYGFKDLAPAGSNCFDRENNGVCNCVTFLIYAVANYARNNTRGNSDLKGHPPLLK